MPQRELVTIEEVWEKPERVLLRSRHTPARTGPGFQTILSHHEVERALLSAQSSRFVALDFETKGGDIAEDIDIVGVGLAWDTGSCYLPWSELFPPIREKVKAFILEHPGLVAHNVPFDGGVVRKLFDEHANWEACTLATYMFLSNEGWTGQTWGLKDAQVDILCWDESNEKELDQWLCVNGYYKGSRMKTDTREARLERFLEGKLKPNKGEMWRAPKDILGKYCILDAESCYLLYTEHLLPLAQKFPDFSDWYHLDFKYMMLEHIDQKLWGIPIDMDGMLSRKLHLEKEIASYSEQALTHPKLVAPIQKIESKLLEELASKQPEEFKKTKPRPPEPIKYKKNGELSKGWIKWSTSADRYLPVVNKNWVKWKERWDKASSGEDPAYKFNLQSGAHLTEVFYSQLKFPIRVTTESGAPGTGIKALKHFGEPGKLLIERAYLEKELSYIDDYYQRGLRLDAHIHPGFRMPGTKTGRLSSKGPNLQQVPKSKAVMSLFRARPGHVWVDLDFSALEPVVATEFSQDPNMMFIYGDGQPSNDIYLYVAAHIPGMGDTIRATGYNPRAPTKEALARAKKECKALRSIAKTVVLACQYGAGVDKVLETLENDDIFMEREEVEKIHKGYWDLFREVKAFGYQLQRDWKKNGGYILNGLGRPMCVTEKYKHDILNRFIQSTGHDILVKYVRVYTEELTRRGIPWKPLILDWHDASAVEVPEEFLEKTKEVYLWGLDRLNEQLHGTIKLKGTPSWGTTLADIKEPEE